MAYVTIDYKAALDFCRDLFPKYGFTKEQSEQVTDVLLRADLYGIESHGLQRLVRYHQEIGFGMVDTQAQPEVVFETPVSAVIDAHKMMGQLAGRFGMEKAIEKAKTTGIGMVVVRNSNHYGIAGYYTKMAADADMIGVCMTNTEAIMVPTFGRKAMLGTDPIAVSMPADPTPFLFDAATTVVPRGKLEVYNKKEQSLPNGWALDADGLGCTDASEVLHNIIHRLGGGILPLGGEGELNSGYKGYGFGMICELCTGILAGGPTANHMTSVGDHADTSHCFWAIDYGIFGDKAQIKSRFSTYLEELRSSPKAKGQDRIYIHGEKELESMGKKQTEGLPVNDKTLSEMRRIGAEMGLDVDRYFGNIGKA
ncbi:Ureidoglycolate dehydrogenase [uncultured Clostridium sp.]|nr:Ureidoglycolate dehydrogenase [uncultured Clostridium sp.]